jgi:MFS family permease
MAVYGMAIGMATLLGNAAGGILGDRLGYEYVFYIGGSLLILGFNLAVFLPNVPGRKPGEGRRSGQELRKMVGLLASSKLRLPYLGIFSQYFAFGGIVTLLPLYLETLGLSSMHFGILLGTFAVVFIAILLFFGHLSDKVGRVGPAAAGLIMAALGVALLPLAGGMPLMVVLMALFGFGYGLFFPSLSALVADVAAPEEYGRATGLYHALLTVGVALGAPVAGGLASLVGTEPALSLASIPLFVAVLLAFRRIGRRS